MLSIQPIGRYRIGRVRIAKSNPSIVSDLAGSGWVSAVTDIFTPVFKDISLLCTGVGIITPIVTLMNEDGIVIDVPLVPSDPTESIDIPLKFS